MTGLLRQISRSKGGLPKFAVSGPVMLGSAGIEGDWQVNRKYHGGPAKAILMVSGEVLDSLKAAGFPVTCGSLGENFTVTGLDPHTSVNLSFDMYAIRSLDGNHEFCCGPDAFKVTVDGVTVLLDSTFTTWSGNTQDYPTVGSAHGSGSIGTSADAFGYGLYFGGADIYRFSFDVPSTASSIKFSFSGNTDQDWADEGFGIDNVKVSTSAVPEPSTYALMIAGLGLGGLMARRRARG